MTMRRRDLMLGSLGAGLALAAGVGRADAQEANSVLELTPAGGTVDQTASLQDAIDRAAKSGEALTLPPGIFGTGPLTLRSGLTMRGVPGRTILRLATGDALLRAEGTDSITLSGLTLDGDAKPLGENGALLSAMNAVRLDISDCRVLNSSENGVVLRGVSGRIANCEIGEIAKAGLFSNDAKGLEIASNHVRDCGDNGIQVWRSQTGEDGTLVTGNRIERIKAKSGGSGQNGNGINIFRAGAVIVANNRISDCAFSAIRDNTGRNCQITGNNCSRLGETAIFVEFSFDGAVVANNVIDTAAIGISVTNFNDGGHLAVVQGNLVRNIFFRKDGDSKGIGIAVEADCAVTGNVVEKVAGFGISIGWYKYLRDITATGNLVRDSHIGIAVSVDGEAGYALITDNMISGAKNGAIRAMNGPKPIGPDLASSGAEAFRNLAIYSNVGI
ncbi:TIGR03808 family TAT-translocated repetitive protein [Methyloligella sp. 2.7D]|uniref:TIGR03808 family TAT-translocated repetitive protein n=1 Tax=unclassified Methyloligella TaxID=2625955 RepID=UPI00157CA5A7|nr:TIGR03808 family TAT-translocated repetitive protein [Methyloligella sp. GL2]QKP77081.1 TIGR03808 family TAT-translocated repetitive protein [Methyloligella sp. GL2]